MALTAKQLQILEAIVFLMRKGEIPTVREVGSLVGLRSSATVSKHLNALKDAKLITMSGKSRGIRIADQQLLESVLSGSEDGAEVGAEVGAAASTDSTTEVESGTQENQATIISAHFPRLSSAGAVPGVGIGLPVVGAIAAGRPIEARSEPFLSADPYDNSYPSLAVDPRMFAGSGDLVAMQIEGDSMVDAGILDGDYVIVRRQKAVENGEIAAVFIDGEGTLKRLYTNSEIPESAAPESTNSDNTDHGLDSSSNHGSSSATETVRLEAANERFDPLVITEDNRKEVLVFGKYVGLVRGDLRIL